MSEDGNITLHLTVTIYMQCHFILISIPLSEPSVSLFVTGVPLSEGDECHRQTFFFY